MLGLGQSWCRWGCRLLRSAALGKVGALRIPGAFLCSRRLGPFPPHPYLPDPPRPQIRICWQSPRARQRVWEAVTGGSGLGRLGLRVSSGVVHDWSIGSAGVDNVASALPASHMDQKGEKLACF